VYGVITSASPKNFEYAKKLGASQVFEYNSETIVDKLISAFKDKNCAGALAIGAVFPGNNAAAESCLEVVDKSEGDKFVAMATTMPKKLPSGVGASSSLTAT
jgi:NADPH:quinone reductase-like Zn-dependent oxidoreductase